MPPALSKDKLSYHPALCEPDHSPGRQGHGRADVMAGIGLDLVCCVQLLEGWAGDGGGGALERKLFYAGILASISRN